MTIERRNPIPAGWYWADIPAAYNNTFQQWIKDNDITVKEVQGHKEEGILWDSDIKTYTYLFYAPKATPWNAPALPTIADEKTKIEDTVERPDPLPDVSDQLTDALPSGAGIKWGLAGLIALGVALVLKKR